MIINLRIPIIITIVLTMLLVTLTTLNILAVDFVRESLRAYSDYSAFVNFILSWGINT